MASTAAGNLPRDLESTRTGASYRKELAKGYEAVRSFCTTRALPDPDLWCRDAALANNILVAFVQSEFNQNRSPHISKHAILAIQTVHRDLKGHLRLSWDALESWLLEADTKLRSPMDPTVLAAVCGTSRQLALQAILSGLCHSAF